MPEKWVVREAIERGQGVLLLEGGDARPLDGHNGLPRTARLEIAPADFAVGTTLIVGDYSLEIVNA